MVAAARIDRNLPFLSWLVEIGTYGTLSKTETLLEWEIERLNMSA